MQSLVVQGQTSVHAEAFPSGDRAAIHDEMITQPDGVLVCDKCGKASTPDEATALREGWLIDKVENSGRVFVNHLCPECQERAITRRS